MPRIDLYEQRTNASGPLGAGPAFSAADASRPYNALAQGTESYLQAQQQIKEQDAAVWTTENLSKLQADWHDELRRRKDEGDPSAPDFRETVLKDYDTAAEKVVAKAPTRASRQFMRERVAAFRGALQNDAGLINAEAAVGKIISTNDQALDRKRSIVQTNPTQFAPLLEEHRVLIENSRLPTEIKRKKIEEARDLLSRDSVVGMIDRNPRGILKALNTEPGKSGVIQVEALNADDRMRLRGMAEAEIARRDAQARALQAEARGTLQQQFQDAAAARSAGLPAQFPARSQYMAAYGVDGAKAYESAQRQVQAFDIIAGASYLPPAEARAKIEALKPTSQDGAAEKMQLYNQASAAYERQRAAVEADPAAAIIGRDLRVRGLYEAAQQGDAAATKKYTQAVLSEQAAIGIAAPRILPAGQAEQLAAALTFDPSKPRQRTENLQALQQQWGGDFVNVMREVAPKLEGTARVLIGMTPENAGRLDAALAQKAELPKLLPKSTKGDTDQAVQSNLADLATTLADNVDFEQRLGEYTEAAQTLAYAMVARGSSPAEAARIASDAVVNGQYEYRGTMRIPKSEPVDAVVAGADRARAAAAAPLPEGSPSAAPTGLVRAGNIDVNARPVVKNGDGYSTVLSMGIGTDDGEVVIPQVSDDGRILSADEAIAQYRKTGKHLGIFKTEADATRYAKALHKQQELAYGARLQISASSYSDSATAQAELKDTIRRQGYWVTDENGEGLVLMIPTQRGRTVVRKADGSRYALTWDELAAMGENAPPGFTKAVIERSGSGPIG